jgi:hypothetical protein
LLRVLRDIFDGGLDATGRAEQEEDYEYAGAGGDWGDEDLEIVDVSNVMENGDAAHADGSERMKRMEKRKVAGTLKIWNCHLRQILQKLLVLPAPLCLWLPHQACLSAKFGLRSHLLLVSMLQLGILTLQCGCLAASWASGTLLR